MSLYVANSLCETTLSFTVRQQFSYSRSSTKRDSYLSDLFNKKYTWGRKLRGICCPDLRGGLRSFVCLFGGGGGPVFKSSVHIHQGLRLLLAVSLHPAEISCHQVQ